MVILGAPGEVGVELGPGGPKSIVVPTTEEATKQVLSEGTVIGSSPSSGGSGRRSRAETRAMERAREEAIRAEQERQRLAELARQEAIRQAEQQKIEAAKTEKLVGALRAREQITQEAEERGRAFSRTEIQSRLKELGTSTTELRVASRAAREQFKRTGVSVTKQIREEAEQRKELREQSQKDIAPEKEVSVPEVVPTQDGGIFGDFLGSVFNPLKTTLSSVVGVSRIPKVAIKNAPSILTTISEKSTALELSLFGERREGAPTQAEQKAELKKQVPLLKFFEYGAEGLVRGGEFLGREKIEPGARQVVKDIIEDVLLFQTFSPLIKTATVQQMESQYAGEVVEVIYKGQKVKMTLEEARRLGLKVVPRTTASAEFGRATPEKQAEILKIAFKAEFKNVKFTDAVSRRQAIEKAIREASNFMRESGLTEQQIQSQIIKLFPEFAPKSTILIAETTGGLVQSAATTQVATTSQSLYQGLNVADLEQIGSVLSVFALKTNQESESASKIATKQDNRVANTLASISLLDVESVTRQRSKTKTLQSSKLLQVPKLTAPTKTIQREVPSRFYPGFRPPTQPRQPEEPIKLPLLRFQPTRVPKKPTGTFGVEVRRGGVFRTIGRAKLPKALALGRERVSGTLAATFKITGPGAKPLKLPGFRTKVTKGGVLFIEKKEKRLSKRTETKEIQIAKRKKKKKGKGVKKK